MKKNHRRNKGNFLNAFSLIPSAISTSGDYPTDDLFEVIKELGYLRDTKSDTVKIIHDVNGERALETGKLRPQLSFTL